MNWKVYNYDKLKEEQINDRVIRVKAIMINKNNEILLAKAFGTVQFPGGHLMDEETLKDGLIREIKEETGITLKEVGEPFFGIKYLLKDYPVVGNNRSIEIYYFYVYTNQVYNLELISLDDQERNGNFKIYYLPLKALKRELKANLKKQEINKVITKEMLLAVKQYRKYVKGCNYG